jgi:hypothetical protein
VSAESDLWDEQDARWQQDPYATRDTPEHIFDRQWAAELIGQVRARLRAEFDERGKLNLHNILAPFLGSEQPHTLTATAARLGMNENALRISLTRMRQDFRHLLLQEVKQTLDEGDDARAEIRHLLALFERR